MPIKSSKLYKIIPDKDKIVYSTLCRVATKGKTGYQNKFYKWNTHVLITRNGFAYTISPEFVNYVIRGRAGNLQFYYWNKSEYKIDRTKYGSYNEIRGKTFHILSFSESELKETFDLRKKYFISLCKLLYEEYQDYLIEMEDYKDKFKEKFAKDGYENFIEKIIPLIYHDQKYVDKASEIIDEALKIIPEKDAIELWYYKGEACRRSYKKEQAVEWYDMVLKIDPNNTEIQHKRDELSLKIKLESISYKDKEIASKLFKKGIEKMKKKKYEEAMKFFEDSLKLNPYDTQTWLNMGKVLEMQGRIKEAMKSYQEILNFNPKDSNAVNNLRRIEIDLEKYGEDIITCKNCGKMLPIDAKFCKECGSKISND